MVEHERETPGYTRSLVSGAIGFALGGALFLLALGDRDAPPDAPEEGALDPTPAAPAAVAPSPPRAETAGEPDPAVYALDRFDRGVQRRKNAARQGRWKPARERAGDSLSAEQEEEIQRLEALGYASGATSSRTAAGITAFDPERAQAGVNLYVSGHAREAILMDMLGETLHTWRCAPIPSDDPRHEQDFLAAAHLFENGDLLVLLGTTGIVKLDRDSNVLWERANGGHHDLEVAEDGSIYVLTREALVDPEIHPDEPVLLDYVAVLDESGNELRRTSIYHAFRDSPFSPSLDHAPPHGDLLHTNTIEVSDGRLAARAPAFARGNVLVSLKFMSTIAMIDLDAEEVVWAMTGMWKWQHRPSILANGNLLVLDNQGGREELGASRVLEFDPLTREVVWSYEGHPENPFETMHSGTCQRLAGGNTLIVESMGGRALEVTPSKEIVWEFVNPHRAGDDGELIAVLFDLVRLPADFPTDWIP